MQFIVIAYDDKNGGRERRLSFEKQHKELSDKMVDEGKHVYGVPLFDENHQINGSAFLVDFPSRKELDDWLKIEPYIIEKVWKKVEIIPCKI